MSNLKTWIVAGLVVAGAIGAFAPTARAHHSAAAHYDTAKSISVQGTVTRFEFVNPHGYVYFVVDNPNGGTPAPWRCEVEARTALERRGWTPTMFAIGRRITFTGLPARREANACALKSFIGEDGIEHLTTEDYSKGVNPLATAAGKNKAARPARLPSGRPNLAGSWIGIGGPNGDQPASIFDPRGGRIDLVDEDKRPGGGAQPTPTGALAAKRYDSRFDDPSLKCHPANIFFAWLRDKHVNEIVQADDTITLKYGYMNLVRTIHLNVNEHPRNMAPSTGGHSIGKWEGDVLVVDTIGFTPGLLVPLTGLHNSARMHTVERYTLDNAARTLTRAYRADDPLYLKSPMVGLDVMRVSDEPYVTYTCVELSGKNNIRPK